MNICKSQFHDRGYWEYGKNRYPIKILPIDSLWASVKIAKVHQGLQFYDPIKKDIAKNGMMFPLLVVTATRRELLVQKALWGPAILQPPFKQTTNWQDLNKLQYTVWGGSNRLQIVKELGYTHVDCCMMLGFEHARAHQKVQRKPYLGKYYAHGE